MAILMLSLTADDHSSNHALRERCVQRAHDTIEVRISAWEQRQERFFAETLRLREHARGESQPSVVRLQMDRRVVDVYSISPLRMKIQDLCAMSTAPVGTQSHDVKVESGNVFGPEFGQLYGQCG